MSAAPHLKVYDASGVYQASCKEPEAAACLATFYGRGATVRYGHGRMVLWTEGEDGVGQESYDLAAELICSRIAELQRVNYERMYGPGSADAILAKARGES